jgi:hypothetical protein
VIAQRDERRGSTADVQVEVVPTRCVGSDHASGDANQPTNCRSVDVCSPKCHHDQTLLPDVSSWLSSPVSQ